MIFQVVGYHNSGKTSLISDLIEAYRKKGLSVASIKHHGHLDSNRENKAKDTDRHQQSGSQLTGLVANHQLQLALPTQTNWALDDVIHLYKQLISYDLLFIEGYKKEHYPKVVMLRDIQDAMLLQELDNIICAVAWCDVKKFKAYSDVPIFHIEDNDQYMPVLIERIGELMYG